MGDVMRSIAVLIVAIVVPAVMGCAPAEEPTAAVEVETLQESPVEDVSVEPDGSLIAAVLVGVWKLESLGGGPVAEDFFTTLEFTEDGRLGGSAGCNNYMGEYTFDEGVLEFPMAVAATKKMCPPPMMEQEDAYLASLAGFERAAVDGDTLSLFVADEDGPLVFSRIVEEHTEH